MTGRARRLRVIGAALVIGSVPMFTISAPALAAGTSIVVNSLGNAVADNGKCTLAEAILAADTDTASGVSTGECPAGSASDADTITFSVSGSITLNGGFFTSSDFTVDGGGTITIDAAGFNVFQINSGTVVIQNLTILNCESGQTGGAINNPGGKVSVSSVEIDGCNSQGGAIANSRTMTIDGSRLSGNSAGGAGGAIENSGRLTITNSTLVDNYVTSGNGGAIYNEGRLTINDSDIEGSSAIGGGAIFNYQTGQMTINRSRLIHNHAVTAPGFTATGGAIINGGGMTISRSTISDNESDGPAGAISNGGSLTITGSTLAGNHSTSGGAIVTYSRMTIANSTITGNQASGDGGAIFATFADEDGQLTVVNATITGNTAGGQGGGIRNRAGLSLTSTIVAGNSAATEPDLSGNVTDGGSNIVGIPSGLTLADILDPGGLQDNGGVTETIALQPSAANPAVDHGDNAACAAAPVNGIDQRGVAREASACDIGAYEVQKPFPTTPPTSTDVGPSPARPSSSVSGITLLLLVAGLLLLAYSFRRERLQR